MSLATLLRSGRVYLPVDDETGASWGAQYHGLSLANGQAFIRVEGINLANYASAENRHKIVISDSASVITKGYIDVADAAEALGAELVTDGDMETDPTTNWTASGTTTSVEVTIIHGGTQALKCSNTLSTGHAYQDISVTAGRLYKVITWARVAIAANDTYRLVIRDQSNNMILNTLTGTDETYTQQVVYFTAPSGCTTIRIRIGGEGSDDITYWDDVSIKEVTDVGTDGVHIVSAKNGSTRNWENIGSGFDYNDSSYTFDVLRYR